MMDFHDNEAPNAAEIDRLTERLRALYVGAGITPAQVGNAAMRCRLRRSELDAFYEVCANEWVDSPKFCPFKKAVDGIRQRRAASEASAFDSPLSKHLAWLRRTWTDPKTLASFARHEDRKFHEQFREASESKIWEHWLFVITAGLETNYLGDATDASRRPCTACDPPCGRSRARCKVLMIREAETEKWERECRTAGVTPHSWLRSFGYEADLSWRSQGAEVF